MPRRAALLWLAAPLLLLLGTADTCTVIVAGRRSTADGSALLVHTDDAGPNPNDPRLIRVPARNHAQGARRPVYFYHFGYPRLVADGLGPGYQPADGQSMFEPLGHIPEVDHTYAYWDMGLGLINEVGLSLAETTCGAKTYGWPVGQPAGENLLSIQELTHLALERCRTARCAVQTMGALAVEHGFYGEDSGEPAKPKQTGSGEALGVVDGDGDAWVFHVLTGAGNRSAIWAAQRVPEGEVCAMPNGYRIQQMNLDDPANFLASPHVEALAQAQGWWDPKKGPFDFTAAYAVELPGPVLPLYIGRRIWRIFDLLAPSLGLDATLGWVPAAQAYPFAVRPDRPLTLPFLRRIVRDHYEGTPYDLTKGVAAGPFANPTRYGGNLVGGGWERAISIHRALFSTICQSRPALPGPLQGLMWLGLDTPHGTVYVPVYGAQPSMPASFGTGRQATLSFHSAWWAFSLVNNWARLRFAHIQPEVVAEQLEWEARADKAVPEWDEAAGALQGKALGEYLSEHAGGFAAKVVAARWRLAMRLIAQYNNGNVVNGEEPGSVVSPGYPAEWLARTDFVSYPGDTWAPPQAQRRSAGPSLWWFGAALVGLAVLCGGGVAFQRRQGAKQQAKYAPLP